MTSRTSSPKTPSADTPSQNTSPTSASNFKTAAPLFDVGIPRGLSEQTLSVWAKTNLADPSDPSYLQLWQHLEDTTATASHVWDDFLPNHVKELLAEDLGGMSEARATLLFLCGVHDAGKASPAFEMMNQRCATRTQHTGLSIEYDFFGVENRSRIRHELVGYHDLCDWLTIRATARPGISSQSDVHSPTTGMLRQVRPTLPAIGLANVVGGHHGASISDEQQLLLRDSAGARLAGLSRESLPSDWQRCRFELFDWMAAANGIDAISPTWLQRPIPKRSQTLLTSDVIMPIVSIFLGGVDFSAMSIPLPNLFGVVSDTPNTLNYGNFLQVTFDFLVIAFSVFLFVRLLSRLNRKQEKPAAPAAPPAPSKEEQLLTEIRDLLKERK